MESLFKSKWEEIAIDLGTIKAKKPVLVTFRRKSNKPRIIKVLVSCNCMVAQARDYEIEVRFEPANVPKHLSMQGFYIVTKRVNVIYEDSSVDELIFVARIEK